MDSETGKNNPPKKRPPRRNPNKLKIHEIRAQRGRITRILMQKALCGE